MRFNIVKNRKKDRRIMANSTRYHNPKNTTVTNSRGGIRM